MAAIIKYKLTSCDYRKIHLETRDGHLCYTVTRKNKSLLTTSNFGKLNCGHCWKILSDDYFMAGL